MQQRPLKFRGRTTSGNWLYGGLSSDKKYIIVGSDFIRVLPETVTQSTGKFDNQKNELFDGDLVRIKEATKIFHGVVAWSEKTASCQVQCNSLTNGTLIFGLSYYSLKNMQKIGTIFDD